MYECYLGLKSKPFNITPDPAQNLDVSLFEEIRMLTNLETSSQKLLQIFLAGQPELDDLLDQGELWQLKQRISTRYHLLPLDHQETKEYSQTTKINPKVAFKNSSFIHSFLKLNIIMV